MKRSFNMTTKELDRLKRTGKIRDYQVTRIGNNLPNQWSREKEWINLNLAYWANAKGLEMVMEHRFHPERKWRFDWALPAIKVAIEYEGIFSEKSGHTTAKGYTKDTDKYNAAQSLGWTVLRFTAINYKNLLNELNKCI